MTKAKTVDTVRERERELYFTNIKCSFIKHGKISNFIEIIKGKNTFIINVKKDRL